MEALCLAQPVLAGIACTCLADVKDVAGVLPTQQLSVRLHKAAAWELGQEAGFGVGSD